MSDLRQSPQYARYLKSLNWDSDKIGQNLVFIRRLPLLGSFLRIPRPVSPIPLTKIDQLAKKYGAFAVKIDYSPAKTLQLDLTLSLKQIENQMKKDGRYGIRKAEKNHLKILISQYPSLLISDFISLWHKNALRRGFWIPFGREIKNLYEAFEKEAYLLFACPMSHVTCRHQLSGALIILHDQTAYYFHAASSPEGRRLSAPYLIIWEAIKLAKKEGCKVFDFEGIYDERFPIKSWKGFTHFKKSFGGKEVEYPASKIKYYHPLFKFLNKFKPPC